MALVEFVGKNLVFITAIGAFTGKGFEILKLLITRTMLGCGHNSLLESILMVDVYGLLLGVFRTAETPKSKAS
jgi:hypothetical protein